MSDDPSTPASSGASPTAPTPLDDAPTFFERAGGEAAIRELVSKLYEKLFDDLMVGFLFQGHDRARIIEQQTIFTSRMLGADVVYTGKPLPEAHAQSPILPAHFDRRHLLLRQVLEASTLDPSVKDAWLRLDLALRPVILKQGRVRIDELRQLRLRSGSTRRFCLGTLVMFLYLPQTPNAAEVSGSSVAGSRVSWVPPIVIAS